MRIGIIGGGIVGATAAYYLAKQSNHTIDLYDDDWISGTKAAVGIICPWVNQRRNQTWYQIVEAGANFYLQLLADLQDERFISYSGGLIINESKHDLLLDLALKRAQVNPIMGKVQTVSDVDMAGFIPKTLHFNKAIDVPGAFQVDGRLLLQILRQKSPTVNYYNQRVQLTTSRQIKGQIYDAIIVAAGAGLPDVLSFDNFTFDYYQQKGMLLEFPYHDNHYRMILPRGEIDLLFKPQQLIIGASHQNTFKDLAFEPEITQQLIMKANPYVNVAGSYHYRIGLRGHNSKNMPFYGSLKKYPHLLIAGGLGSSGLTSGPLIGYRLAQSLLQNELNVLPAADVNNFIY